MTRTTRRRTATPSGMSVAGEARKPCNMTATSQLLSAEQTDALGDLGKHLGNLDGPRRPGREDAADEGRQSAEQEAPPERVYRDEKGVQEGDRELEPAQDQVDQYVG